MFHLPVEAVQIRDGPVNRVDAYLRLNEILEVLEQNGQFLSQIVLVVCAFELGCCFEIEDLIFKAFEGQLILRFPVSLKEMQAEPYYRDLFSYIFSRPDLNLFSFFLLFLLSSSTKEASDPRTDA